MTIVAPLFGHPPEALAAIAGGREISYGELCADIDRAAAFLRTEGLGPTSTVGIVGPPRGSGDYRTWIAHLAAMRIGAAHASIHDGKALERLLEMTELHAMIGELPGASVPSDVKIIQLDLDSLPSADGATDDESTAARLNLTSGTTGAAKLVRWDSDMIASRVDQVADVGTIGPQTCLASMLGLRTTAGFRYPLATWRAGGCVVLSEPDTTVDGAPPVTRSTLFVASPFQLRMLMTRRVRWPDRVGRTIVVAGGRLPPRLRGWALANIGDKFIVSYGSTETGNIAFGDAAVIDRHPGAVGKIREGVDVEIIGDDGAPVERGTVGTVRLRTPLMAGDNTHDGWFEPGDLGILYDDGVLAIEGRSTDVLNLGGLKMGAEEVESRLLALPQVEDAAITILNLPLRDLLAVAVVTSGGVTPQELLPSVRPLIAGSVEFRLVFVRSIPRNAMGKIDRARLAELLMARDPVGNKMKKEHA